MTSASSYSRQAFLPPFCPPPDCRRLRPMPNPCALFNPQLGEIRNNHVFKFGGPLKPVAWAAVMKRTLIEKPETQHLIAGPTCAIRRDAWSIRRSRRSLGRCQSSTPWGPVSADEELTPDQSQSPQGPNPAGPSRSRLHARYAVRRSRFRPSAFRKYTIPKFETSAPPHWGLQAANYVAKVRRVYGTIEEYERKPAKHRVAVGWHANNIGPWAAELYGQCGITMPFGNWAATSTTMPSPGHWSMRCSHTFRYGHGEPMDRAEPRSVGGWNGFGGTWPTTPNLNQAPPSSSLTLSTRRVEKSSR